MPVQRRTSGGTWVEVNQPLRKQWDVQRQARVRRRTGSGTWVTASPIPPLTVTPTSVNRTGGESEYLNNGLSASGGDNEIYSWFFISGGEGLTLTASSGPTIEVESLGPGFPVTRTGTVRCSTDGGTKTFDVPCTFIHGNEA